jgi:hypothetical protein
MMSRPARLKNNRNARVLLPIGTLVEVTGGSFPGQQATILGHTAKMYHVKLESGKITVIRQENVIPIFSSSAKNLSTEVRSSYQCFIGDEGEKFYRSLATIVVLLDRMNLEESETSSKGEGVPE